MHVLTEDDELKLALWWAYENCGDGPLLYPPFSDRDDWNLYLSGAAPRTKAVITGSGTGFPSLHQLPGNVRKALLAAYRARPDKAQPRAEDLPPVRLVTWGPDNELQYHDCEVLGLGPGGALEVECQMVDDLIHRHEGHG